MRLLKFISNEEGKATFLFFKFKLKTPLLPPFPWLVLNTAREDKGKREERTRERSGGEEVHAVEKAILGTVSTTHKPLTLLNI